MEQCFSERNFSLLSSWPMTVNELININVIFSNLVMSEVGRGTNQPYSLTWVRFRVLLGDISSKGGVGEKKPQNGLIRAD